MAAKAKPTGAVPDNGPHARSQAVKQDDGGKADPATIEEKHDQVETPPPRAASSSEKDTDPDLDEKDLEAVEDGKKIPYQRFKSVNEKKRELEAELSGLRSEYDRKLERAVEEAERRAAERVKGEIESQRDQETLDPWERTDKTLRGEIGRLQDELKNLRSEGEHSRLQTQIEKLKNQYPEADELAVLGWKRSNPGLSLDDLMEKSHADNTARVEKRLREIIEKKKEKRSRAVSTGSGSFTIPEGERPKNLKDAHKAVMRFFKSNGQV